MGKRNTENYLQPNQLFFPTCHTHFFLKNKAKRVLLAMVGGQALELVFLRGVTD
jgi:hypothetical protein